MKFVNLLLFTLLFLFVVSCTQKQNWPDSIAAQDTITINPHTATDVNYSQLFSAAEYIPIPSDSDFLIGNIDKLLIEEDHIIIMDKNITHAVFIFHKAEAKAIQLNKQGSGPGEYVVLQDIFWDETKQAIAIFCNIRKKLLYYDLDGNFIEEQPFPVRGGRIKPVGDNYALYCDYRQNLQAKQKRTYPNVLLSDNSGRIRHTADLFPEKTDTKLVYSSLPDFSIVNNTTVAIKPDHSNVVYHLLQDSIIPAYLLNFEKYNIDRRYWEKATEQHMTFDKLTDYCNTVGFCESFHYLEDNEYLFFHYRQNMHIYTVFYSKKTGQLIHAKSFLNDMDKITAFHPVLLKDNRIYCLLKAEDINTAKLFLTENNLLPTEILNTVEEFDNPVIAVFTLKDF